MDNIIFLQGETIHLRALEEADLNSEYLQWLNDEEVCQFNSHAVFPNTQKKMKAYYDSLHNQNTNIVFAIVYSETNRHIGNVSLQNINWISRSGEFAILLGAKQYWGKGIARQAMTLVMQYGFKRLNLHRIYCGTLEGNIAMRKLAQRLRMREEGIRKEALFKNGKYHDIYEFGIIYNEYYNQI
jgi:ribosomal-protein-alanine N-acetyltransferase